MRNTLWASLLWASLSCALSAAAAAEDGPVGRWLTQDRDGVIEVAPCGTGLCGRIVGLTYGAHEPMPVDAQGRPQCGLVIFAMQPEGDRWRGRITNPEDGSEWRAEIWMGEDGALRLRGYLGIPLLGRTQIWTRFQGRIGAGCRFG